VADKEDSGSILEALLERAPVLDGGGRRRFTAGTLVVLAIVLTFDSLRSRIAEMIAAKEASLPLFLASGTLLIYGTGVIVELIGEVFLARAVSNAAWSYVAAAEYVQEWRSFRKVAGWVAIVIIWGTIRAIGYFVLGLFGATRWRMRFRWLSSDARRAYDRLPDSIRHALEHALGNKAEFGRKAIIDKLNTLETRRWARRLMDRPRDVLALISAVVLSFTISLSQTAFITSAHSMIANQIKSDSL
jgi:hypothetical protein